jgi:hypothetical protein
MCRKRTGVKAGACAGIIERIAMAATAAVFCAAGAWGTSIGIDFIGNNGGTEGWSVKTKPMAPAESAGVVVQKNWNSVADCSAGGATGTKTGLLDDQGNTTSASVAWQGDGGFCIEIADSPGDYRMMRGYLDIFDNWREITVSGLPDPIAEGFDMYVYVAGHSEGVPTIGRYQVGEEYIDFTDNLFVRTAPENTDFTGTHDSSTAGKGSYVVFHDLSGPSVTLRAKGQETIPHGDLRAPVNGIQLVGKNGPQVSLRRPAFTATASITVSTAPVVLFDIRGKRFGTAGGRQAGGIGVACTARGNRHSARKILRPR